ncbi:GNAT family N-acetyltransferase [Candidatus Woesearchaeota archaeon]|nr:GNAT family N-acetyltransferase [Candidatus Woesearchaeota archaeon]
MKQIDSLIPIFWEYWAVINGEDLSGFDEFESYGHKIKMSKAESHLYWYLNKGDQVQLLYNKDEIVGFMIYHNIYDCIIAVRCLYLIPEYFNNGLGKQMVSSLESDKRKIDRVIFQTRRDSPPEQFLKACVNKYGKKIAEDDKLITWEMDWS